MPIAWAGLALPVALAFLASCGLMMDTVDPLRLPNTPEELRMELKANESRTDSEAAIGRARIYARLRELENPASQEFLANGDAADIDLLSQAARPEQKGESSTRLARHFRERARNPALCRSAFLGPLADPLRRVLLLVIAGSFGEYASRAEHALALNELSEAAGRLASLEALKPDAQKQWQQRAKWNAVQAEKQRTDDRPADPSDETRKFCEVTITRHLEDADRATNNGTRELAARGDPDRVLEWYLAALAHYVLVKECVLTPGPSQEHYLATMEIVVRSLSDLLCREP